MKESGLAEKIELVICSPLSRYSLAWPFLRPCNASQMRWLVFFTAAVVCVCVFLILIYSFLEEKGQNISY